MASLGITISIISLVDDNQYHELRGSSQVVGSIGKKLSVEANYELLALIRCPLTTRQTSDQIGPTGRIQQQLTTAHSHWSSPTLSVCSL